MIGLDPCSYGTHSLRRTKATLIYKKTGNLRVVQLLLGHTKVESTVRYLGIEVDDAPAGHSVSNAYTTTLSQTAEPRAGSAAESAEWVGDWKMQTLAFDHAEILADAEKVTLGQLPRARSNLAG